MKVTLLTTPRATANKWLYDNFAPHIAKNIIKMANTMLGKGHGTVGEMEMSLRQEAIRCWREQDPDMLIIDQNSSVHVSERMTNPDLEDAVFTYIMIHDQARIELEKRNSSAGKDAKE